MAEVSQTEAAKTVDSVLKYAARGWRVFPIFEANGEDCSCSKGAKCDRVGKHPRVKNGLKDATTDVDTIKAWWDKWPNANVGIRTGDGLGVVDIDPDKGGDDTLAELEQLHGEVPETLRVLTGGGGMHFYFQTERKIRSSCGDDGHGLGPGIDTRGEGGYVVAPPSNHESGGTYEWDLGGGTDLEVYPTWLVPPPTRRLPAAEDEDPDAFIGERRNVYLTSYCGKMRRIGMSQSVLKAALMAENARRCRPPLDEDEVARIAKSVARYAPEGAVQVTDHSKPEWYSLLRMTGKDNSRIKNSPGNAAVLLSHRDEWHDVLLYNEFADRIEWAKDAPDGGGPGRPMAGDHFADHHICYATHWLCRYCGPDFSKDAVHTAMQIAARNNTVHPVKEYLEALQWDGFDRVGDWLTDYLGVGRTAYTQAVGQWWMISAIARVYKPGCQADHMLVLEGQQGVGKSSAARILAGPWYLGSLPDLRSKDSGHALQGHWIVEVGELDAFRGAGATRVKDYLSQVVDSYRPAYARLFVRRERQCVFLATTNEDAYLDDATGGRRFWPVKTSKLARSALENDRDQLWAEALHLYRGGAQWWPTRSLSSHIREQQEERNRTDPWEEKIEPWIKHKAMVTGLEVLVDCIDMEASRIEQRHYRRVGEIMRQLGWVRTRRYVDGKRQRAFYNPAMVTEEDGL